RWATEAVFRILDDERVKQQHGRFTREDCMRLWKDSQFADMHTELLALMQQFELCYPLADGEPQTWLAPQLLPPIMPSILSARAQPDDGEIVSRYRYDFVPRGLLARLTVRLQRLVRDPEMAWSRGVLFERDHASTLVELLNDGRVIELRARG